MTIYKSTPYAERLQAFEDLWLGEGLAGERKKCRMGGSKASGGKKGHFDLRWPVRPAYCAGSGGFRVACRMHKG